MVFHWRLHPPQKADFKVSHLCYASYPYSQYQVAVKLPGSFRLTAGNRHLHRYCIFTGHFSETVPQSLRLSCASELHVFPLFLMVQTISSSKRVENFFLGIFSFSARIHPECDAEDTRKTLFVSMFASTHGVANFSKKTIILL